MEVDIEQHKKTLIAKRGLLKSNLTRFVNFVNDARNRDKTIELSERASKIEKVFDNFDEIQSAIELIDFSDIQTNERHEFENKYFSIISVTKQIIKGNESLCLAAAAATAQQNAQGIVPPVQPTPQLVSYQLPPISLPNFDGSYEKWSNFFDTFSSLIHNNTNLVCIQKFHYLQSALKGEALKVIDSLEINDQNYSVAIDLLTKRFENKKHAIRGHMKNIFELQSVNRESHSALRNFLDTFQKHYRCLLNLGEPIESSKTVLIYLLLSKLDNSTKREWEIKTKDTVSPEIDTFIKFLTDRCMILESIDTKSLELTDKKFTQKPKYVHTSMNKYFCVYCQNTEHGISYCEGFLNLNVSSRLEKAKGLGLCVNCLRRGHSARSCTSKFSCQICGKKHNRLLHLENESNKPSSHQQGAEHNKNRFNPKTDGQSLNVIEQNRENQSSNVSCCQNIQSDSSVVNCSHGKCNNYTILSTAQVYIYDCDNKPILCKALLDSASQSNFITSELFQTLKLPYSRTRMPIVGINAVTSNITQSAKTKIQSIVNNNKFNLSFLVIDKITETLPQQTIDPVNLNIPDHIKLADPEFYCSSKIDILIGASIFYELLLPNQIKLGPNKPILQSTKLGFVLGGNICASFIPENYVCKFVQNSDMSILENQLEAFWRIEECTEKESIYTKEELECEEHFVETFQRNEKSGHFIVQLPFKNNLSQLGNSLNLASSRFQTLEHKLAKNPESKIQYSAFLREYEDLGHMSPVALNITDSSFNKFYYLPHHSVYKGSSLTTKLRVVFNASAKSSSNLSLNDVLKTGPCIQEPLFWILLRFRIHSIVFTADVTKMYRCILVDESQRDYQRILWRSEPSQELTHYQLNTVTYGTAPASFLATRCLKQLSLENQDRFPQASRSISEGFYMDD